MKVGSKNSKVAVIGGGFSGLSVAALLARDGFEVSLFEKNPDLGGRAHVWRSDGFVFDMGPSWYLMPDVFETYFAEFNKKPSDYYSLKRLDPSYRIFFENHGVTDIPADLAASHALFDSFEAGGSKKLSIYLEKVAYQYRVALGRFIYRPYRSFRDILDWKLMVEGATLGIFGSLDSFVRKHFTSLQARQILEYSTVFLGSDPARTPAMYALMAHVDFKLGVWYPQGGVGKVVEGFAELAKSNGVKIFTDQPVSKIEVGKNSKASAVLTNSGRHEVDLVVGSADYHHIETKLLEPEQRSYTESYWQSRTVAPSALLFYLGVSKRIPNLEHHNLYFLEDWQKHFNTIFSAPSWPQKPCYYVCCPSKSDPTVAPEGSENIFVLVPVAAGLQDSDDQREKLFQEVMKHLEQLTGSSILDNLLVKRVFSHRDFNATYNAFKGTGLGLAHTLFQTALFRPSFRSKKIKNLFYTGHYTHPGIGVPMVIIASQIAAKEINKEFN